jgi:hypothetical protein
MSEKAAWTSIVLLLAVAASAPFVWSHYDKQRRLELKQTAFAACISHQHRKLSDCERMRPPVLAPGTAAICEMGHLPRECFDMIHNMTATAQISSSR